MRYAAVVVSLMCSAAFAADKKCPPGDARVVTVNSKNDEWTATDLTVDKGDLVVIEASGKVVVGSWAGETDANGTGGKQLGRLMFKTGDSGGDAIGASYFYVAATKVGLLKLKVFDTKYEDNDGAFTVTVRRIPACAVPQPK